jgi:pimeloyl-ACP methyl ester carboxylesterase
VRRRVVEIDLPLVVREWPADGMPLVYWGGLNPAAPHDLVTAGPVWSERYGLRALAVSPPGLGETPRVDVEGFRPSALAALVVRLLDGLAVERVVFVGASWGGFVGCRLAGLAPERLVGLVLLDAGHKDIGPAGSLADWTAVTRGLGVEFPDLDAAGSAIWGMAREPPSETWPALAASSVPVLLLAAGEYPAAFARAVPQADVRVVPGAGHDVLGDAPDHVVAAVGEWLR